MTKTLKSPDLAMLITTQVVAVKNSYATIEISFYPSNVIYYKFLLNKTRNSSNLNRRSNGYNLYICLSPSGTPCTRGVTRLNVLQEDRLTRP